MSSNGRAHVVVASTRAAAGVYDDRSGPIIESWLAQRDFDVAKDVVPDGDSVGQAIARAVHNGARLVITTGGTGLSPTDHTPEQTRALVDREVPGLADAIRAAGAPTVPTAVLSRGIVGVYQGALVVNLPGSTGGVRDGLGVLDGVLMHALAQLAGGDH